MKKYELTQEQINQLAEKKHAKELLKEFIPEAFENKLEVGKWYKSKYNKTKILFFTKKETCSSDTGYGFNYLGIYKEKNFNLLGSETYEFELATEEEVKEALINEAIKRGFKNVGELSLKIVSGEMFKKGSFVTTNNNFIYISVENRLYLDGVDIFYNGKWAEIIKEEKPTQEEIDRVINYLKNK